MKRLTLIVTCLISLLLMSGISFAYPTLSGYTVWDLDDWTSLYDDGEAVDIGAPPALGYESRAFIVFSDIKYSTTPGGSDVGYEWIAGLTDGTYLQGVEKNVVISQISPQADGSTTIYFSHATMDPLSPLFWEVELYNTGITNATFIDGANFLPLGPTQFNTIYNNLVTDASSSLYLQGRFSTSTYWDPTLGAFVNAVVAINIPVTLAGGIWVPQVTTPYGLAPDSFIDVDPLTGGGSVFIPGFYGLSAVDGSPYDLELENIQLSATLFEYGWITSDDDMRGAIPEPSTLILLGSGLFGIGFFARRRLNKK